jgi:hypothetical protein
VLMAEGGSPPHSTRQAHRRTPEVIGACVRGACQVCSDPTHTRCSPTQPFRHPPVLSEAGERVVSVAESVLAPPGPIPNPVVTQSSAGEYCGGDPVGGEAAADTTLLLALPNPCRGVEQRQLVGLITQRSRVRIPPPPLPAVVPFRTTAFPLPRRTRPL